MNKLTTIFLTLLGFISIQAQEVEFKKVLGYVEPYRKINMTSPEAGVIANVYVQEGSYVKKGEPIMSLDTSVLEAQLRIAQVSASSNANIAVAQADYNVSANRSNLLVQKQRSGSAHATEVSRAKAEVKMAEGRVQNAREEKLIAQHRVDEIKAQIERRILRSPIDGIILEVNRDVAESANIAQKAGEKEAALARIAQLDRLRLMVHLPADLIGNLKVGDSMAVLILNKNSLQANRSDSSTKVNGTIEFLSPDIDPSSETIRTRIVIKNYKNQFRSGSHAYALLPIPKTDYSTQANSN